VPCCFPTCNSVTYAFVDGEAVTPLTRVLNVDDYLDYITNRSVVDLNAELKASLEGAMVLIRGAEWGQGRLAVCRLLPL
jgi:hypothetical protein